MLIADNNIKHLGTIKYGVPQTFIYKLVNMYYTNVQIQKIIVGCTSCTKASIDKWDIDVRDTATVTVTFTPGSTGLQSKKITIIYNTGNIERPPVELLIKAQVND